MESNNLQEQLQKISMISHFQKFSVKRLERMVGMHDYGISRNRETLEATLKKAREEMDTATKEWQLHYLRDVVFESLRDHILSLKPTVVFVEELEEYTAFSSHWNKLKRSIIYTYQAQVYYNTKEGALEEELIDVGGPRDQ